MSVIIPTFNCAAYLAQAVRSVLEQTHPAAEIIVVDDGSTDETMDVVARLGDAITYLRQDNAGAAAARNGGLARATGDVVAFLDADDYWAPEKLATQLAVLELCPDVDLVCADFWLAGDDRRDSFIKRKYRTFSVYRLDWPAIFPTRVRLPGTRVDAWTGSVFAALFLGNFINTSSVLLRRRAFERVGSFSERLRTQEDYEYWLQVARTAECAFVDQPLLAFRRRPNQLTASSQAVRIAEDVLTVIEDMAPHARQVLPPALVAKRLSERCVAVARTLIWTRQRAHARQMLRRARTYRPLSLSVNGLMLRSFLPASLDRAFRQVLSTVRGG